MSMTDQAPGGEGNTPAPDNFTEEFASFLGTSIMDQDASSDPVTPAPTDPLAVNNTPPVAPVVPEQTPAAQPVPQSPPASQSNAAPAADTNAQPAGQQQPAPDISDADIAAVLGVGQVAPADAPAGGETPPAAAAAPAEFSPFQVNANFIPPQVLTAIFDSDNRETQAQALSSLLSSVANASASAAVKHVRETLAPEFERQMASSAEQRNTQQAVVNFYAQNYPELTQYGPLVERALKTIAAKDPKAPITADLLHKAGNLARTAAQRLGLGAPASVSSGAPATAPSAAKPPLYAAGGARPANIGDPPDPNSPAATYESMTRFDWG